MDDKILAKHQLLNVTYQYAWYQHERLAWKAIVTVDYVKINILPACNLTVILHIFTADHLATLTKSWQAKGVNTSSLSTNGIMFAPR